MQAVYREYVPCEALRASVRTLFSFSEPADRPADGLLSLDVRFGADERVCAPTFADGHPCIVISFAREYGADGEWRSLDSSVNGEVIGPMTMVGPAAITVRRESIGAYLRAGVVIPGLPASELENRIVDLEDLCGWEANRLVDDLCSIPGQPARIARLEAHLVGRLALPPRAERSIDVRGVTAWITKRGGRLTVESLADTTGLSRQHFTRVFRTAIGVGPKTWCRLSRFQSTLRVLRGGGVVNWAEVAAESGYADQSHMIAEFRRFTGLTPEALLDGRLFHPFIERVWQPGLGSRRRYTDA